MDAIPRVNLGVNPGINLGVNPSGFYFEKAEWILIPSVKTDGINFHQSSNKKRVRQPQYHVERVAGAFTEWIELIPSVQT